MNKQLICIVCPRGCHLEAQIDKDNIIVNGNNCVRGMSYAIEEINNPKRNIASTIAVRNGKYKVVSVATTKPIAKSKIFEVMEIIKKLEAIAPVKAGQVVLENIDEDGTNLVITRNMEALYE